MKKLLIMLATVAVLSSCNSSSDKSTETAENTENKTSEMTPAVEEEASAVMVDLESNDMMKFNKAEIKVAAGSTVTLTLKHTGKMPKAAMGHNFVLLKKGTDIPEFATAAVAAKENDYIPESDAVIAHTGLVGGGESTTVTFEAPSAGAYDFICSFPGHYAAMQGKFIVE